MKSKKLYFFLSLAGLSSLLFSCGNDVSSSSTSESEETSSSQTSSEESILPPTLNKDDFSYLLGTYNGKLGKLTLDEKSIQIEGKVELTLIPTSLGKVDVSTDPSKKKEVISVNFDSSFDVGNSYRAYVDLYGDGFLHLDKINGDAFATLGTFQPNVSKYAGSYSAYGDSSSYNIYTVLDGEFDYERNVYLAARVSGYDGIWSYEQNWSYVSRLREDNSNVFQPTIVTTLELTDSDNYGYGEERIDVIEDDSGDQTIRLFESQYNSVSNYLDPGALNGFNVFDGTNSIALSMDPDNKTLTFGDFTGTYVTKIDEEGMRVDATSSSSTLSFRIGSHYIKVSNDNETNLYPVDTVSNLKGEYSKDGEVIKITVDDENNLKLSVNEVAINPNYIIYNKRKALSFSYNNKNYIVAPDNDENESSILVSIDGNISYYINESLYLSLFFDEFVAHDKKNQFNLTVGSDLSFKIDEKTGKFAFSYWHGDKYPSLVGNLESTPYALSLVQSDIGYYSLNNGEEEIKLYSKKILDKVYGDYSSNGRDNFTLSTSSLTIGDKEDSYEFDPFYQVGTGTYLFAISSNGQTYKNNLNGTFYTDDTFYIRKSLFAELAGTYSLYGKYGIENITFTSDGHLYLDTVNQDKTGLIKDVEYDYSILTQPNSDNKAMLAFNFNKDTSIFIYFHNGYVTIASLNYYEQDILNTWGTYADTDLTNVLYVQNNKIYLNGTDLPILSRTKEGDSKVVTTSQGTFTFKEDGNVTYKNGDSSVELTKKLDYLDFDKFVGNYTVDNKTFSFTKGEISGYALTVDGISYGLDSMVITNYNGSLTLVVSVFLAKYRLSINLSSGEVSPSYDAGSLPPPPPLPRQ
ncbi:MAG TPA: hypothetical protein DEF61_01120 [Firmicutes bacterium]|nr:hypothetical protein [Bacillota bacterium]